MNKSVSIIFSADRNSRKAKKCPSVHISSSPPIDMGTTLYVRGNNGMMDKYLIQLFAWYTNAIRNFGCLRLVSCVPNNASFAGLSIFDCSFGIHWRLFRNERLTLIMYKHWEWQSEENQHKNNRNKQNQKQSKKQNKNNTETKKAAAQTKSTTAETKT